MSDEWVISTLGEVAEVCGGGTPSTKEPSYWGGDVFWLTPTEVVKADGQRIARSERTITREGLAGSSAKLLPAGSVLLTTRASVGFTAIAEVPLATNQGFQSLIPGAGILPEFLMYWIQGNRDEFSRRAGGSTFPEVSKSKVSAIPIAYPPLSVQRRIVDLVAHLDDHLASLRAERERAQGLWLTAVDLAFGEESWPRTPIGEAVTSGGGRLVDGDWIESKDQSPSGIRLLQLADIARGWFVDKSERFVSQETFTRLRCTAIQRGDLLISRMADPIGRTALVPDQLAGSIAAVDVAILTPGDHMDTQFLLGILNSTQWIALCDERGTGTTRKRVSKGNLMKIDIPVPDLITQKEWGGQFEACSRLVAALQAEIAAFSDLRSGILSRVLRGDALIPDDYDLLLESVA